MATFKQQFNIALRLLGDLQESMGDSNYQIYHDGEKWGLVLDGTFQEAGYELDDLITLLEDEIAEYDK